MILTISHSTKPTQFNAFATSYANINFTIWNSMFIHEIFSFLLVLLNENFVYQLMTQQMKFNFIILSDAVISCFHITIRNMFLVLC